MVTGYKRLRTRNATAAPADPWDDPTIKTYLRRSRRAEREQIDAELARIDDQLARRETLHDDLMSELKWHIKKYERELDRVAVPFAPKTEVRKWMTAQLKTVRQEIRDEQRQYWQDRQRLEQERRDLLRERATLMDEDLSELL